MSFSRPLLSTLRDRAMSDINGKVPNAESRLRRSYLTAMATMHAGGMHGLYGALQNLALDILPDTSSEDVLVRQATLKGIYRKAAIAATGPATVPGTNGVTIPDQTVIQRPDGVEFVTSGDQEIANGSATLALTCVQGGTIGTTIAGTQLSFASPIDGVGSTVTVGASGLVGYDEEAIDSLRARLLKRLAQPPQGGSSSDYEQWTLAYPEVTRVWVYPKWMGAGTVGLTFTMDARANPIPLAADVANVAAYLNALRPVTADVYVFAPTPVPFTPTIAQLSPAGTASQTAIYAQLADLLYREAEPGGLLPLSHIREAISLATGVNDYVLQTPTADVQSQPGQLLVPGQPTYV